MTEEQINAYFAPADLDDTAWCLIRPLLVDYVTLREAGKLRASDDARLSATAFEVAALFGDDAYDYVRMFSHEQPASFAPEEP
jgi:hypothetical protein